MNNNPEESIYTTPDELHAIEVHLTPECAREYLTASLQRTRRRIVRLLDELVKATHQPVPEPARIRELSEGVQFESELAQELALALADPPNNSDF